MAHRDALANQPDQSKYCGCSIDLLERAATECQYCALALIFRSCANLYDDSGARPDALHAAKV